MQTFLRFGTWNTNCSNPGRSGYKLALLQHRDWDILALQEVNVELWNEIQSTDWNAVYSMDHLGDIDKPHGVALVAKKCIELTNDRLIPFIDPPADEFRPFDAGRAMTATASTPLGEIQAVSFHSMDGSKRALKQHMYATLHRYLRTIECGLLGFDANLNGDALITEVPRADDEWYDEHAFRDHQADHSFRDAYHQVLRNNPALLAEKRALGLEDYRSGCLAVTYQQKYFGKVKGDRKDRIYITPQLFAAHVEHLFADAVAAGSDHALVIATLTQSEAIAKTTEA